VVIVVVELGPPFVWGEFARPRGEEVGDILGLPSDESEESEARVESCWSASCWAWRCWATLVSKSAFTLAFKYTSFSINASASAYRFWAARIKTTWVSRSWIYLSSVNSEASGLWDVSVNRSNPKRINSAALS